MILLMLFKMIIEVMDTIRQQGNLHLRRTGIRRVYLELLDYFTFT